jgi:hypothetical protein
VPRQLRRGGGAVFGAISIIILISLEAIGNKPIFSLKSTK